MTLRRHRPASTRRGRGIALVAVLYFLVLAALTSIAVVFGTRFASRRNVEARTDAALIAAGDAILYGALSHWNGAEHARQAVGATVVSHPATARDILATLSVTRLASRMFSLVAEVRGLPNGPARRLALLVRVPFPEPSLTAALVSAVDVSIDSAARLTLDTAACADTAGATLIVAPGVSVAIDSAVLPDQRPAIRVDSSASDSTRYLQFGESSWSDLVAGADVRLLPDAALAPLPVAAGGVCIDGPANWGEPADSASPCSTRAPVVYAPGDLTIEGGRGQGVLLVDGRLVITGPFAYSGQIVVRRGIETRADAISISGVVLAWRAASESTRTRATRSDVVLTHHTSLRASRCDAAHGMQSWLQPRAIRLRAWTELF